MAQNFPTEYSSSSSTHAESVKPKTSAKQQLTLVPSQGAKNQFFIAGNLIMNQADNKEDLRKELKKANAIINDTEQTINGLFWKMETSQFQFDDEFEDFNEKLENHSEVIGEVCFAKGIRNKREKLMKKAKKAMK